MLKLNLGLNTQLDLKMQYFKYVMIGCLGYSFRQKKKTMQLGLHNVIILIKKTLALKELFSSSI